MLFHASYCTQGWLKPGNSRKNEGQGLLEYGLILFLIVIGIIVAASLLGDEIKAFYEFIVAELISLLS